MIFSTYHTSFRPKLKNTCFWCTQKLLRKLKSDKMGVCFYLLLQMTINRNCKLFLSHFVYRWTQESEKLESLNAELKAQIEELKNQKQQLVYMLNLHRPTCIVRAHNGQTPEDERNLFIQQIKETTLQCMNISAAGSADPAVLGTCDHL